jgi:hypothetical protein
MEPRQTILVRIEELTESFFIGTLQEIKERLDILPNEYRGYENFEIRLRSYYKYGPSFQLMGYREETDDEYTARVRQDFIRLQRKLKEEEMAKERKEREEYARLYLKFEGKVPHEIVPEAE